MRQFKSLHLAILALGSLCFSSAYAGSTLVPMSDAELSATRGQALMSMSYIAPTDAASNSSTNGNMGFYRLALDAQLELNANIKKLQLGCGGVNGAGACDIDIDIDYLSLSGGTVDSTSAERAASSAVITNPFLEFAVKNPNSASTREIQGFRLSAKSLSGLLTFGLQNGDAASGINSLSGYLVTKPTGGTVTTNPYYGITQDETGTAITGRAQFIGNVATLPFTSTDYNLNLGAGSGTLSMGQQIITGNVTGTVNNLDVNVAIKQSLGYFHAAQLNGSAGYLSVQGVNILWPEAASTAQTGWWLELTNPIDIGQITPTGSVDIALATINDALGQVSSYLNSNPVACGPLALSCLAGNLPIGNVDLAGKTPASMSLTNVVLQKQNFSANCYGSLKFC